MDQHFYYSSLRNTTAQFLDLFNGISVAKYNAKGKKVKEVGVPLKYSTKEKFYYWLYDLKSEATLPCMAVSLQSLDHDETRKGNPNFKFLQAEVVEGQKQLTEGVLAVSNPAPYTVGYQLSIACEHMIELDQIIEQILPFFDPVVYVRIKMDELNDFEFDAKVVFSGSAFDISQEVDEASNRLVNATMDFSVHTYLFKPRTDLGLVKKIHMPMYARIDLDAVPSSKEITINEEEKTFSTPAKGQDAPHEILAVKGEMGREIDEILVKYEIYTNEGEDD